MAPRVMVIYGTRPEAIKIAPLIAEMQTSNLEPLPVVTGQHREMLDQVNDLFEIKPLADLEVLTPGQSLNRLMSKVFAGLDSVLAEHQPDAVLVQGDTATVTAAALAAFYRSTKVIHLEAGLRSGNLYSPFPEEANRRIVSQIADLHLTPTRESKENLLREGVDPARIAVTGNTVIDALLRTVNKEDPYSMEVLRSLDEHDGRVLLVTAHRRENWENMDDIARAVREMSHTLDVAKIVVPMHANPAIQEKLIATLGDLENVLLCDSLSYADFTRVMSRSHVILSDSGGVQEEAPALGKPVLVMRTNTERPEAIAAGTARLVGTDPDRLVAEVSELWCNHEAYQSMARAENPYGDGQATRRAIAAIEDLFGVGSRLPDFVWHQDVS